LDGPRFAITKRLISLAGGNKNVSHPSTLSLPQEPALESPAAPTRLVDQSLTPEALSSATEPAASTEICDGGEFYERATTLKNVGLFRQAAEHFEKALRDPAFALKGLAQMGLCHKKSGRLEEAVSAFRKALQVPSASSKEQVQILYLLGRTLEALGCVPEALEAYRWLRREAPQYRDVAMRIESLSTRRRMQPY
jgi:tetratricopeptide (TPR) repeat protein